MLRGLRDHPGGPRGLAGAVGVRDRALARHHRLALPQRGRQPRFGLIAEHLAHEPAERHRRQRHPRRHRERLECLEQRAGGLVALLRIDCERLHDDRLEGLWVTLDQTRRAHHIAGDDAMHRVEVGVRAEAAVLRRDLVEDDAEREHVAAAIDIAPAALLGRHVRELALDDARLGLDRSRRRLRDAEVEQLHAAVVADHDVRRRHVAMHDAERHAIAAAPLMRVVEPGGRAGDHGQRELERHTRALASSLREQRAQVLPVHVLHREVMNAAVLAHLEYLRDVLVVEAGGEPRFIQEHLHCGVVVRALGCDELQYDMPLERADARRPPDVDPRHAARCKRHEDLVLAETCG